METTKGNSLSRGRVLSVLCLIVFVLFFIFACMYNTINFGLKIVGTFGVTIYPVLIVLSLICFAKFLGLNYKRSFKATIFMVLFIFCLLGVVHSIRTFSMLDAVASKSTYIEYLNYSYSNLTLLGSFGCLVSGAISYLLGGMGTIVVFVILATIFIGLFIDYELYGKYDQKHIRKLNSRKMREKVLQSDSNSSNGKPNYSFSNNEPYSEDDVVAEITANFNEAQDDSYIDNRPYSDSDVVDEITDNQVYDSNQSYYQNGNNGNYPYNQDNYFGQNSDYQSNYNNSNYNSSWQTNPFGADAGEKQELNRFSNSVYKEQSYPDVYDENEERRKFLQATFNTDYNPNGNNSSYAEEQSSNYISSSYSDTYNSLNSSDDYSSNFSSYSNDEQEEDSGRISKRDMEWKFNDDDFNYSYQFNGEDEDSSTQSNDSFNSSSVDDQISEILKNDSHIEDSIKDDFNNNFNFSSVSSSNDFTDSSNYSSSYDDYNISSNNSSFNDDQTGSNSHYEEKSSSNYYEPSYSDLDNVKIPAKEPVKKANSSLKMGMSGMKYNAPPIDLLNPAQIDDGNYEQEQARKAKGLEIALDSFNIPVSVANIVRGPKITRYELSVPLGVSIKKIPNYELDIKKTLAAKTINIQAPIPGTEFVGIELENDTFTNISQRELFESDAFKNCTDPLPIAIGKDISGDVIVSSLTKMVHVLIAGQTGSGKSVFIHSLIMSLIYKYSPEDLRLVLIDPKRVEFNIYNGVPHLLTPEVVLGTEKAVNALKWCVKEMDRRYDLMSKSGYSNIVPYNNSELVKSGQFERFPYIVIVFDEFAEVMMANKKDVEACIQRITQLARACGMHLILATQRPSVDVMSGVIKNNVPTRIAFSLSSSFDSKTILGTIGAENLLGQGDMLYKPNGTSVMYRLQAAYCTDEEIKKVIDYDINHNSVDYDESVSNMINSSESSYSEGTESNGDNPPPPKELDPYFKTAIKISMQNGSTSASYLQRRLQIGYARSARILDQLENRGYISQASGSKTRKVLITPEQFKREFNEDIDLSSIDDSNGGSGEF